MTSSKRRIAAFVCFACLLGFLFLIFFLGAKQKKQDLIRDLIRHPEAVSIVVTSTSRIPSSITSIVIGSVDAKGVAAFSGAPSDVGPWGQVAEFDLTDALLFQDVPESIAKEFGPFPFPSEYRTWEQTIAGFYAKVELYFEPRARRFVAYVYNQH